MERVLQGLGSLNMGGAETMVVNVLENLDRRKVTFDFVIPGAEEGLLEPRVIRLAQRCIICRSGANPFGNRIAFFIELFGTVVIERFTCIHKTAFFTALHVWLAEGQGRRRLSSTATTRWTGAAA